MVETTVMDVYVKGVQVFSFVREVGDFKMTDVEVVIYDEGVDNRRSSS